MKVNLTLEITPEEAIAMGEWLRKIDKEESPAPIQPMPPYRNMWSNPVKYYPMDATPKIWNGHYVDSLGPSAAIDFCKNALVVEDLGSEISLFPKGSPKYQPLSKSLFRVRKPISTWDSVVGRTQTERDPSLYLSEHEVPDNWTNEIVSFKKPSEAPESFNVTENLSVLEDMGKTVRLNSSSNMTIFKKLLFVHKSHR